MSDYFTAFFTFRCSLDLQFFILGRCYIHTRHHIYLPSYPLVVWFKIQFPVIVVRYRWIYGWSGNVRRNLSSILLNLFTLMGSSESSQIPGFRRSTCSSLKSLIPLILRVLPLMSSFLCCLLHRLWDRSPTAASLDQFYIPVHFWDHH